MNLAASVCGYTPINLGKLIKAGILADIDSIHRQTIDRAAEKKQRNLEIVEEQKSEKDHTECSPL